MASFISGLPPLAGLCTYEEAARPGLAVERTVDRLRRYVYLKSQLVFLFAARFNGLPEWEVKGAISLHLWQDAEHSAWFRKRVTEMRTPPFHLDRVPDPALEALVEELKRAKDTAEFLTGVYEIIKPAMADAFREHLREAHSVADQPTRRLLQFVLVDEDEQMAWGTSALAALRSQPWGPKASDRLAPWREHVRAYLGAAGGINGTAPRLPLDALPAPRRTEPFVPSRSPRRDERFQRVWTSRGFAPDVSCPLHERIWWMMFVRLNEMHVSELIATVLVDWREQPWDFYHDLARHLWDETRHCMFGEIAFASQGIDFTQMPAHLGFAEYPNTQLSAPDRYAFLWGIEQSLMGKSGKQAQVALAQAGGDEQAAMFQDFDWADEVLHTQIGRRWLEPRYGDREKVNAVYDRARAAFDQGQENDLKAPGRNWWPAFYERHLKDKDPQLGRPPG